MEWALLTFAAVAIVVGLVGCFIPCLPGVTLAYVGLCALWFSERFPISGVELLLSGVLVILSFILEMVIPMIGAKRFGGGKAGMTGCVIGTLIGLFFSFPGLILGPFLGAVIGEWLVGKPFRPAVLAGVGTFLGFFLGMIINVFFCLIFVVQFFRAVL